jgi:glycosyltransferase involved in cell wall biosynthesis
MRFFRGVKPDIVHIQYLSPGLLPILAARLSGVRRLFGTVHQLGNPYGFRAKLMIRIAGRLCAGFVCVSKAVEESWFGDASIFDRAAFTKGRKHFTIHNGVDVAHLQQMAKLVDPEALRKTLALNDEPIVGIVARLTAEKGHDLLLQAMQIVISNVSRAMLIVVGDGPDRQRLVNRANDLGLSGRVRWLGEMDPARVYGIYKLMDVVVVPSVYEGFGFAAVEAMAVGRPVVATHTGGLAEIIEDGVTGYLVTPRAPKEFAQKIIALLGAPQMGVAMGKAGQERVQRHFALDKFGESLLKAYQATLNA